MQRIDGEQRRPACTNCVKAGARCEFPESSDEGPTRPRSSSATLVRRGIPRRRGKDLGYLHKTPSGQSQYFGPSFWAISGQDVCKVPLCPFRCEGEVLLIRIRLQSCTIPSRSITMVQIQLRSVKAAKFCTIGTAPSIPPYFAF